MSGFDDFLAGYNPGELEATRTVQVVGTDFSELLRMYEKVLDGEGHASYDYVGFVRNNREVTEVLTPAEINSFFQATNRYEDHQLYSKKTGSMVSGLIQNSYNRGYNNFFLNTKNLPRISNLGAHIIGTKDDPIHISVEGNLCNKVGFAAYYSHFLLNGAVGIFGGWEAKHCTFKTPIWETIQQLRGRVLTGYNNTLIYIDQGKEVVIK